ncbi:MAG: OsmC family protein, partial [Thermoleophilia bacterium]
TLRTERDPEAGLIGRIILDMQLPAEFPEKYKAAIINAVELCTVKRHMHQPPQFEVNALIG